jgi:hypothetical protein
MHFITRYEAPVDLLPTTSEVLVPGIASMQRASKGSRRPRDQ